MAFSGVIILLLLASFFVVQGHSSPSDGSNDNNNLLGLVSSFEKDLVRSVTPESTSEREPAMYALAQVWDFVRLNFMWPAQGLRPKDIRGGIMKAQAAAYAKLILSSSTPITTVCETGFYRGGSALFWLLLTPGVHVHAFDRSVNFRARRFLDQHFPGQVTFHEGDSRLTLPEFVAQVANGDAQPCNFISVDGDHTGDGPYRDILNLAKAAAPQAILVADDTFPCSIPVREPQCKFCDDCPCDVSRPYCNDGSRGFSKAVLEGVIQPLSFRVKGDAAFGLEGAPHCQTIGLVAGTTPSGFCAARVVQGRS